MDVVGERLVAVHEDDRDALAIPPLELRVARDVDFLELEVELVPKRAHLRERPLAEVAASRVEDRDPRGRGHA